MIPYGLQGRMRRAPFESHGRRTVPAGRAGQRRPVALERIPDDDSTVETTARWDTDRVASSSAT
jgi:hypothetical protein